ncbi:hypothetical protein R1sor_008143 [Riccia sorocarpa]|uniref:Uncharacterized protein n=1 Tax=Riccia sorocarpa TaxID=122646 RepID=A0ABD3HVD6_9MARC
MARTKQTTRKYPAGKPPDPRRDQQYKLTQALVKKRRMSDEDRSRMEEAEEEEQEEEAEVEAEEEAEEEEADEDEIGTLELFRMIRASETKDHAGPWCTEMAKIPYAHISNTHFREKEDLCFHIQVGAYAGMDTNRTVKPTEVFEKLVEFEEELKSVKGKNKRKADGEGTVKLKKSRST